MTGDATFAKEFLARYIYDSELPDYEALLALAGFELRLVDEDAPALGLTAQKATKGVVVSSAVRGGPAYVAGLDRQDVIKELAGKNVESEQELAEAVASFGPGDRAEIVFVERGEERRAQVVFEQNPRLEVVTFERAGRTVTPAIETFRKAWLTSALDHNLEKHWHECVRSFVRERLRPLRRQEAGRGSQALIMFDPEGPTLFELARQALSSTEHGYDLLAPKFDVTPFRTPDAILTRAARTSASIWSRGESWIFAAALERCWRCSTTNTRLGSIGAGA